VATVNKLSAGDYAIQIGQLHLTLSPDQLRSLPVSAHTASSLPAASTKVPRRLKVFLCHASGDKPAVHDLYRCLRSDRVAPWLDEEDLLPGQDWHMLGAHCRPILAENTWHNLGDQTDSA